MSGEEKSYRCPNQTCGYVYDPERGDKKSKTPKGTCFDDLADDWYCPVCKAKKETFACVED
jgi:rubredoxin